MKASKKAQKIIHAVGYCLLSLLHACNEGSPVLVPWVTLGKLVIVVPCYHALQVCDDRALLV